jgi:hypothetical protein
MYGFRRQIRRTELQRRLAASQIILKIGNLTPKHWIVIQQCNPNKMKQLNRTLQKTLIFHQKIFPKSKKVAIFATANKETRWPDLLEKWQSGRLRQS